jgi:serine/threonine protein kinase
VHEAYLRLVGPTGDRDFANRAHFFAAAAEAMRRILIDSARRKQALKRGEAQRPVDLDPVNMFAPTVDADSWIDLDDALTAVQHAHQKGIIHRDLKPGNILVESHDEKPVPKVIDFGLAKATTGMQLTEHTLFTAFGNVMGTPTYMAPEQATFNAVDVDTRADVYSLGVILYELLTGTTPITRETVKKAAIDEMLKLIREQEAPKPSSRLSTSDGVPHIAANRNIDPARLSNLLRGDLDWVVLKALEKDRQRRYETASGFARDIEHYLNDEPVLACPPSARYRLRKFVRRNKAPLITGGLIALSLVVGTVVIRFASRFSPSDKARCWRRRIARYQRHEFSARDPLRIKGSDC